MSNILIKKNYLNKVKLLNKYNKFYYDKSNPIVSDQEYDDLKLDVNPKWPLVDKKELEEERISYVIQVNGKKRDIIETKKDISESELLKEIKNNGTTTRA